MGSSFNRRSLHHLTIKARGGGGGFLLITSEVESFSTRNFVTFPNIKGRIRKNKKFRNLNFGSRDMTIFGERTS